MKKNIAVLTGGGDCPGLNAVIRAVAKKAMLEHDFGVIGIEDGFLGLIQDRHRNLRYEEVSGILTLGGTILGTSNTANPFRYAEGKHGAAGPRDVSAAVIRNFKRLKAACLICIGGEGTLGIAHRLALQGLPVVGVPKTIDNDIHGTDVSFGFDSAVTVAADGIDRVHTTAQSHHRVMIVEVMGRNAGWIALHAGIAGGGDIILIPEIPYAFDTVRAKVLARRRTGKRFSIIVIAEGAREKGGKQIGVTKARAGQDEIRLGGIGFLLGERIEKETGIEARTVVLGHLQRGGAPTAADRVLATRFGTEAVAMMDRKDFGTMVGIKGHRLVRVPLQTVARGARSVPLKHPLLGTARSVGTCFGD